jgi:hypothetical protein
MSSELVRDRLVLGLLFIVGGSSLLWGLYLIFYVAQTSPSGIFNTILGLLVLLVTWGFLLPYALPAERAERTARAPSASEAGIRAPPARAAPAPTPGGAPARPLPRPSASAPGVTRPSPTPAQRPLPRVVPPPIAVRPSSPPASVPGTPLEVPSGRLLPTTAVGPTAEERRSSEEDKEIDSILADLPGPVDPTLAGASPDEMIRRLDALLDDLSSGSS